MPRLTLERIGELKLDAGDAAGALTAYEKILANRRRAAELSGESPDRQRDVAVTLATLGDLKLRSGDLQGALAAYQECFDIRSGVAKQDIANVAAQRELAQALSSLGYAKFRNGDYPGALASYDEGSPSRANLPSPTRPTRARSATSRFWLPALATPSSTPATMTARSRPTRKVSPSAGSSPPPTPATPI